MVMRSYDRELFCLSDSDAGARSIDDLAPLVDRLIFLCDSRAISFYVSIGCAAKSARSVVGCCSLCVTRISTSCGLPRTRSSSRSFWSLLRDRVCGGGSSSSWSYRGQGTATSRMSIFPSYVVHLVELSCFGCNHGCSRAGFLSLGQYRNLR